MILAHRPPVSLLVAGQATQRPPREQPQPPADPIVEVFQRGCCAVASGACGAAHGAVRGLVAGSLGRLARRNDAQRQAATRIRIANVVTGGIVGAALAGPLGCVGGIVAGVYSNVGLVGAVTEGARLGTGAARAGWRSGTLEAAGDHLNALGDELITAGTQQPTYDAFAQRLQRALA